MRAKDKRISELLHWISDDTKKANIPTIMNHAIQRYKVTEKTARSYAIAIMKKLGLLSKPMKVSSIEWQWEKDRTSGLHYPKFVKSSELYD